MTVDRIVVYPVVVLGDLIAAAADDLRIDLAAADARRLAVHTVELLELAGYELVETDDEPPPRIY